MKMSDAVSPALETHPLAPVKLGGLGPRRTHSSSVLRVLVLDDNEDDFAFVKVLLGKSVLCRYELEWAATEQAALEAIRETRESII